MEIAPNVHRVTVGDAYNNVYLVTGDRAIFIDSGHDDAEEVNALLECWESVGRPEVAAILLTHRHADHAGGASRLAEATQGVIISSPTEKAHIERGLPGTRVGRTVSDGETLDLGGATVEFVHTPGHTIGSLSAYYREGGVLFAGDTIRNTGPFVMDPSAGDLGLHLDSLQKLLVYDLRLIGPGHGPEVDRPRPFIEHELAILAPHK